MFLLLSYFGFVICVPGEGNGVVGNLLDVADGVEALLVVSCNKKKFGDSFSSRVRCTAEPTKLV